MFESEAVNERGDVWVPKSQSAEWRRRAEAGETVQLTPGQLIALLRTLDLCHEHEAAMLQHTRTIDRINATRASKVRKILRRHYRNGNKIQALRMLGDGLAEQLRIAVALNSDAEEVSHWLRAIRLWEQGRGVSGRAGAAVVGTQHRGATPESAGSTPASRSTGWPE